MGPRTLGWIYGFVGVVSVVVQAGVIGPLTIRFGAQSLTRAGALLVAVGMAAIPFAHTMGGLLVALGLFGVGAAIPLVAVAYASRAGFTRARGWVLARIGVIKTVFAVLLGLMGLAILTGADKWIEARVNALLPEGWVGLTVMF